LRKKASKHIAGLIAYALVLILFIIAANLEYKKAIEVQKRELVSSLNILQGQIENQLNRHMRNINGIVAYIKVNPNLEESEFEYYSSNLISSDDKVIRNITLIEGAKIKYVYPKAGNETALALDLSTIPSQYEAVRYVYTTGKMAIDGPVSLAQGGKGLIYRVPVNTTYSNSSPLTQISYVANYDKFIEITGIKEALKTYNLRIVQVDSKQKSIVSNREFFSENTIVSSILLPNTKWNIFISYKNDYDGKTNTFYILIALGFFMGFLSYLYVVNLIKSRNNLEQALFVQNEIREQLILAEKLVALGRLTSDIGHEVNTPIGTSITLATFLVDTKNHFANKYKAGVLSKKDVAIFIEKSSAALDALKSNLDTVSDLVKKFKLLSANQELENIAFLDLKDYISDILASDIANLKKDGHKLNIVSHDDIKIYSDKIALSQIFKNLVSNTIDHGFDGMKNGTIDILIYRNQKNDSICIEYKDNGIGIDEELSDKIFTPFFSTKKSKHHIGLGLHLVYNSVVSKLGGHIELKNALDGGVHFYIEFPEKKHPNI
jgi:signal transduction histidine kinase